MTALWLAGLDLFWVDGAAVVLFAARVSIGASLGMLVVGAGLAPAPVR